MLLSYAHQTHYRINAYLIHIISCLYPAPYLIIFPGLFHISIQKENKVIDMTVREGSGWVWGLKWWTNILCVDFGRTALDFGE